MHEGVSDILVARARQLDGVSRPISVSFAVHIGLLATLALLPSAWFASKAPEKLMVISLGAGAIGPTPNGQTALAGQKVEQVAPTPPKPEPIVPTNPKSTAVVEPLKTAVKPPPPKAATNTPPQQAQITSTSKPTTGEQIKAGTAVAATTSNGIGVGLSSGGLGGAALDTDFCCPDWITLMTNRIIWHQSQGIAGEVQIQFDVERDGSITNPVVKKRAGYSLLDTDAQRAVLLAKLPPLPPQYGPNRLTVTLTFPYIK